MGDLAIHISHTGDEEVLSEALASAWACWIVTDSVCAEKNLSTGSCGSGERLLS
ncbi:hypothetical protein RIEGSTA812A_PEG_651 [invertebrate metagenome]|uniref:Uncharacterized protein n=1 Tax=invertebrate metagenome TaxID=1711999 RepID=A0A484HAM7_9ZZZZ